LAHVQAVLYDALARCLVDALHNLDLSYFPLAPAAPGDAPGDAGGDTGGRGGGGGEGGGGGGAAAGPVGEDMEEAAMLAAELGAGLVAGNPQDMVAFVSLSGEGPGGLGGRMWGMRLRMVVSPVLRCRTSLAN
jgi:hypothetical protein